MQLGLALDPPPLRVCVLGSGSGGNAVVVEAGGRRILIDAGFSCRELERRLRRVGVEPRTIAAILLTHEHEDHVRGAARFAKRHGAPVCATDGTLAGARLCGREGVATRPLRSGEPAEVEGFTVESFLLPHDAREPVGFLVEDADGRRLGLVADLGSRTQLAWGRLRDLDLLLLETNHDLEMLRSGPYPWSLKQRIASSHGHLSNEAAAHGLADLLCDRLRTVVLYHLSRTNNLSALALAAVLERLAAEGARAEALVSDQFEPTPWMEIA